MSQYAIRPKLLEALRTERRLFPSRNSDRKIISTPEDWNWPTSPGEEPQPATYILAREAYAATCVQIAVIEAML